MWTLCSGTLNLSLLDVCAVGAPRAQSDSALLRLGGWAETGRTRLPHVAHQVKREFEAALELTLQWP